MTEEPDNGEEAIDESGRNLTQQRIDKDEAEEGGTGADDGGPGSQNM
jgi:hypothetical protein